MEYNNYNFKRMKGKKFDLGKPPVTQMLKQFPRAIKAVAAVSEYGHKKYGEAENDNRWDNWEHVENAEFRYAQAKGRHLLEEEGEYDKESGHLHLAHTAWNTLAELELRLRKKEKEGVVKKKKKCKK